MSTSASPLTAAAGLGEVLQLFRGRPSLTRADVMQLTGLSRSTVNQRLDALLGAALVVPSGEGSSTGGRPASRFTFHRDRGVLLVADIGATGMRTALCDLRGEVLAERERTIDVADGPGPVLSAADSQFRELLSEAGRDAGEVFGIGIDVPGPVDFDSGQVVSPPIMSGWDRYDIPGWFAGRYACPVLVDKDVNAMALGEQRTFYPDVRQMLMVKAGTGVGAGMILGGEVYRGADGAAGDIGHIQVTVEDAEVEPVCRCGNTGCVEAYAGGWALVRDLRAAGKEVTTVDDAVALIRTGDVTAVRLARRAGRIIGHAIADSVSLVNPRVVVIGGQLARIEEQLFAGIREMVYRRSLPLATRSLQIVATRLDNRSGLVGLALLLADGIFAPERVEALVARG
ncbi:putative NBD/HSP70 family sugar kinase [Actinoplanes octamycinicus]|uniref:Putative NBD/HSP70 family sugar kinase n=1 Tax=Actinoplanes octamycinicus TaxID=135948 RepID=A0A7W7M9F9_9ACTN|nr:ROK family transcriptional regulator [Actinoplanes octamycinicus]MBB4741887.1 putative NBD/HSP70 family sugar kinase [Actinoplanes octamycinicus]GIE60650.1 sugar kinase [Actinoplanes octamycinicus]